MKKWLFRLAVTGVFILGLLIIIVLNPILIYAHQTPAGSFTIYHNSTLNPLLPARLHSAQQLLQHSELYNPNLKLNVCLNDGSYYPTLMRQLRGPALHGAFITR